MSHKAEFYSSVSKWVNIDLYGSITQNKSRLNECQVHLVELIFYGISHQTCSHSPGIT